MLTEQNTTANGEVHAEGEVAPFIKAEAGAVITAATSNSPTRLEGIEDIQEPVGPPGGPLQGSYVSGVIPEGAGGGTDPGGPGEDIAPVLTSLDPETAVKDSPDFTLHCLGSGFTESSVIMFAGQPEPIQFISDTDISTGVKPSLGWGTNTPLPVSVKNGDKESAELSFTFTDPPEADEQDDNGGYRRKKNHKKGK